MKTNHYQPRSKFEVAFFNDYQRLRRLQNRIMRNKALSASKEDVARAYGYMCACREERCAEFLPPGYWLLRWMMIFQELSGVEIEILPSDRELIKEALHIFYEEQNARQCASLVVTGLIVGCGLDLSYWSVPPFRAFLKKTARELPNVL